VNIKSQKLTDIQKRFLNGQFEAGFRLRKSQLNATNQRTYKDFTLSMTRDEGTSRRWNSSNHGLYSIRHRHATTLTIAIGLYHELGSFLSCLRSIPINPNVTIPLIPINPNLAIR
jgi:hypothetical protein